MEQATHLQRLENELAADLDEARRLVELGRHDAMAVLDSDQDQLGELRDIAGHHIESAAHNADEDLKLVRQRLGELHLLLSREELRDIGIFDHFRDRVVEAMEFAEDDMEELKHRGDAWCSKEGQICNAWNQLSRRLSLVRMHLVQEVETATREFKAERKEMLSWDPQDRHRKLGSLSRILFPHAKMPSSTRTRENDLEDKD